MAATARTRDGLAVAPQIWRLAGELRRQGQLALAGEDWLASSNLRPIATGVVRIVDGRGEISQREISDLLGLDPSDLVSILDQLEELGLVERRRDPTDRRRNVVVITDKGRPLADHLADLSAQSEAIVFARLSAAERRELARLLGRALGDS
ncbi:MAG TPA: MarR family winged helix-turn-helix transcriptional regulator [Mycobacteriales bacterium]|nr:MarR family winged helix-turn-helix transcriptional regulator [Mycobacteriales bacterium]